MELFSDDLIKENLAFRGGTALIRPEVEFNMEEAYELVKIELIEKI